MIYTLADRVEGFDEVHQNIYSDCSVRVEAKWTRQFAMRDFTLPACSDHDISRSETRNWLMSSKVVRNGNGA